MTNISIPVEILAGADIYEVVDELIELSEKLGVMVEANFNGYRLFITKHSVKEQIIDRFNQRRM